MAAINPVTKIHTGRGQQSYNCGVSPATRTVVSGNDCNGLSTPALVDVNLDGLVDYAYAGDLLGNLWKFDLRSTNINEWKVAYNTAADGSGDPAPLFEARNISGFRQPITTRPDVMRHPLRSRQGYLVLFGTGRYLGYDDYLDGGAVQSVYGIWDWAPEWAQPTDKAFGYFTTDRQLSNLVANPAIPETDQEVVVLNLTSSQIGDKVTVNGVQFTQRPVTSVANREFLGATGLAKCINDAIYGVGTATAEASTSEVTLRSYPPGGTLSVIINGNITQETRELKASLLSQNIIYDDGQYLVISANPINWFRPSTATGEHLGWYFNLPFNSERAVNNVVIRDGVLWAVSTIPSESPCKAGGDYVIYTLNAANGGRLSDAVLDINGDFRVNNTDTIDIGTPSNPNDVPVGGERGSGLGTSPGFVNNPNGVADAAHISDSRGRIKSKIIAKEKLGFHYWRTW
jgi:type IV pilus assembly protein PilY1